MKRIALLSVLVIAGIVAFTLHTAPALDRSAAVAQINTHQLTLQTKNLADNTVAEAF